MKQLEVSIMGHGYVLGCPEGGEALLAQAVERVDREMTQIRDSGKVKARERIAVLSALNLAYQMAEAQALRAATAPTSGPAPSGGDEQVQGLIERIDAVLGEDGQLL